MDENLMVYMESFAIISVKRKNLSKFNTIIWF